MSTVTRHGDAYLVSGAHVNWVLVADDDGVTLIDGGYPKDADAVEASVREIGRTPEEIRGALLTHAHVDHLGGLVTLAQRWGFPVATGAAEVGHARRDYLQQLGPAQIPLVVWRPGALRWLLDISRLGGLDRTGISATQPYDPATLRLPGAPVPVATPGHTDGHTAYLIPGSRVLVTGDALVTGHAIVRRHGPQLIPDAFTHDRTAAVASLDVLADVDADVIFPGHGPAWEGTPRDAVAAARASA